MNKSISINQIAVTLLLIITGGKFLSLPSLVSEQVGHDSWLVFLFNFALDFICLLFVLWAVKLNTNKCSLDEILSCNVTNVGSKIIYTIFFVVFVSRIIVLLNFCYKTFSVTFDVNTNWIAFVLPIIAVSAFAISLGINSVARFCQLIVVVVCVSVVALLAFAGKQVQLGSLLPVGECGVLQVTKVGIRRSFWFSDYIFIYFMLENIDVQRSKKTFLPILICFLVGVVLTLALDVIFVCLYGELSSIADIAMSQIGIFSLTTSSVGRWDWLTLSIWIVSVFVKVIVFVYCAYVCVEKIFSTHFTKLNWPTIVVIALLCMLPMFVAIDDFVNVFIPSCVVPFAVVQYLLPICMPFFTAKANRSKQ